MKKLKNMKYLKKFEAKEDINDKIGLLKDLMKENPIHKTHDFYIFIASDDFKESKDGLYKKTIDIENMVRITPDGHSVAAMQGMEMRVRFNPQSSLYHIWLPKDVRDDVEGKGSQSLEPWLVDLINEHKQKGADEHSKQVYRDVVNRREEDKKAIVVADKFNL